MSAKERETLLEVQEDGWVLVLLDGRRLRVDAEHIATTCIWLPTAELELEDLPSGVLVTNLEEKERITAQWDVETGEEPTRVRRKSGISRKRPKSKRHG